MGGQPPVRASGEPGRDINGFRVRASRESNREVKDHWVRASLEFTARERAVLINQGISPQLIYYWTSGSGLPGKRMALRLSMLLKRPVIEFLYGTKEAKEIRKREARYVA